MAGQHIFHDCMASEFKLQVACLIRPHTIVQRLMHSSSSHIIVSTSLSVCMCGWWVPYLACIIVNFTLASHSESQPTEVDRCRILEEYTFLRSGKVGHRKLKEGLEQTLGYITEHLLHRSKLSIWYEIDTCTLNSNLIWQHWLMSWEHTLQHIDQYLVHTVLLPIHPHTSIPLDPHTFHVHSVSYTQLWNKEKYFTVYCVCIRNRPMASS